jgi:hypothetical protein
LLGDKNDELPEGWGQHGDDCAGDVDMEITFTPGLDASKGEPEETTLDKYQRKMKEKRRKRKDEMKRIAAEDTRNAKVEDNFFDVDSGGGNMAQDSARRKNKPKEDRQTSPEALSRSLITTEELSLLATSHDLDAEPKHFNLKSVLRAEKKAKGGTKKRLKKGEDDDNEVQDDFKINVKDDRFKALHYDHTFAIDPSNPQYVF